MIRDAAHSLLLTPGPVSVSRTTKAVMIDRPSGDADFQADTAYANEAVLTTLIPTGGKVLNHTNGVYGDRLIEICAATGTPRAVLHTPPFAPATEDAFEATLRADPAITHVMVVHCETSAGILNPLEPAASACRRHAADGVLNRGPR